jgi:hypothetical protein
VILTIPFLTDLDTRAAVKGSRDPLGIQQIWTRLGRHVVGNLTTVSNSVRDFTTLLLGYYFAARLADDLGPGTELATFLKWEQLAAYARATANKDFAFRGTERVKKNLSEGSRVTLSDDRAQQILGNQKIYGLWGLYTMPARASGLVDGDPPRLTPPALELVERLYLPVLEEGAGKNARRIRDALRRKSSRIDVHGDDKSVISAVGRVLGHRLLAREREFYRFHLLHGGPTDATEGRQQQLAELLEGTLGDDDFGWSTARVGSLAKTARLRGDDWHPLAHRLERIRISETVLGPVSVLFTHLLGLDGKSVDVVRKRVRDAWGAGLRTVDPTAFGELRGEIAADDAATGDRWVAIADAVATGEYATLVDLLLAQNRAVMTVRGGTSWIEKRHDRLHVRFRDEQGRLPLRDDIPKLWRFPYFLDSLRNVASAVKED